MPVRAFDGLAANAMSETDSKKKVRAPQSPRHAMVHAPFLTRSGAGVHRGIERRVWILLIASAVVLALAGCGTLAPRMRSDFHSFILNESTPTDAEFQAELESVDSRLRARYGMTTQQTAAGALDLATLRLAMVRPDQIDYAASVPKIAILLAYFQMHPEAATNIDLQTKDELSRMVKVSDNEMAAKYSRQLGLKQIQQILDSYHLYDVAHGGGLWVGKHYGQGGERYVDPIGNHSHAATVRQLLRFYLWLEQGKLVSPAACKVMRDIFASPNLMHVNDKFVKGLAGRNVQLLRKSGWWEDWHHDTAIVTGGGRHYIVVAMTHHPQGEEYLIDFAQAVDDLIVQPTSRN